MAQNATMKLRNKLLLWFVGLPLTLVLLLQCWYLLHICWWVNHNPASTAFMRTQLEKLQEKNPNAELQHVWVPYNRISVHLKRAIIAAEDANFAEHDGVDWEALQRAYEKNAKKGKVVSGGSTITQQLAKNLFLSGQRSYLRKAQEMAITFMLEMVMDKRRIFEIYLNVIELGSGVFGAEAGARQRGDDRRRPAVARVAFRRTTLEGGHGLRRAAAGRLALHSQGVPKGIANP